MNDRISMQAAETTTVKESWPAVLGMTSSRIGWQRMAVALLVILLFVAPAGALAAPETLDSGYVVRSGDTLANIAARMGVSVWALAEANGIQDVDLIHPGQVLVAPDASTYVATQPAPKTESGGYGARWIEVDIGEQWLTAWEGNTPVFGTPVSTAGPEYWTPRGDFAIQVKYRWTYMAGADYFYDDVPCTMYFADYLAIHGTYWHNDFGTAVSHGCVNTPVPNACWLFDWASVGTGVWIHD